jgi:hypothetical protein
MDPFPDEATGDGYLADAVWLNERYVSINISSCNVLTTIISTLLGAEQFESEQTESRSTEGESRDNRDSGFDEWSPLHSDPSKLPPTACEIDQWQRHISLQNFAEDLQNAAKSVYPNGPRSRYSSVYVLIFKWEVEDPKLPVSYEIAELRKVLDEIYHYNIEVFEIPEKRSHAKVSEKVNTFVAINEDSKDDLKIVYYAGHGKLSKTRDLLWTRYALISGTGSFLDGFTSHVDTEYFY